jgi:hypothetical protein
MWRHARIAALALATAFIFGCADEPDPDWIQITKNVYLNPSTIKVRDGHTSAWFDFRREPSRIFFWRSTKHYLRLEAIDCQNDRMAKMPTRRNLGRSYDANEDSLKLQFEYVVPDSAAEAMLQAVCRPSR